MTADDIARLGELLDKATPGPWAFRSHGGAPHFRVCGLQEVGQVWTGADARLIAESRNALPALLDALEAERTARVAAEAERDAALCAEKSAKECWMAAGRERIAAEAEATELRAEVARLRDALQRIVKWSDTYPTRVFPKPDLARAAAVLSAAGLSLDTISADNMRHATEGVGSLARAALEAKP